MDLSGSRMALVRLILILGCSLCCTISWDMFKIIVSTGIFGLLVSLRSWKCTYCSVEVRLTVLLSQVKPWLKPYFLLFGYSLLVVTIWLKFLKFYTLYNGYTGWHIRLWRTSRWLQNESSILAWPVLAWPVQNGTFVFMSTGGGLPKPDVSPCRSLKRLWIPCRSLLRHLSVGRKS